MTGRPRALLLAALGSPCCWVSSSTWSCSAPTSPPRGSRTSRSAGRSCWLLPPWRCARRAPAWRSCSRSSASRGSPAPWSRRSRCCTGVRWCTSPSHGRPGGCRVLPPAAVAVAYAAAAVPGAWGSEAGTVALAGGVVLAAVLHRRAARGPLGRARQQGLRVTAAVAVLLAASAAVRLALPRGEADAATLVAYQLALVAVAVVAAAAAGSGSGREAPVTDLVLQLGGRSGAVAEALARLLDDPSLRVGYRSGDGFVDASGRLVDLPRPDDGRAVTPVLHAGEQVAVLVHDARGAHRPGAARGGRGRGPAVGGARPPAAAGRAAAARPHRLAAAAADRADTERARLAQRVADGADRRLAELADGLQRVRSAGLRRGRRRRRGRAGRAGPHARRPAGPGRRPRPVVAGVGRAAGGAAGPRRPLAPAGHGQRTRDRAPPGGPDGRVVRLRGGAGERGPARARDPRLRRPRRRRRLAAGDASPTTAPAAPTSRPARACAACRTASRPWEAASPSVRPRTAAPRCARCSRSAVRRRRSPPPGARRWEHPAMTGVRRRARR